MKGPLGVTYIATALALTPDLSVFSCALILEGAAFEWSNETFGLWLTVKGLIVGLTLGVPSGGTLGKPAGGDSI